MTNESDLTATLAPDDPNVLASKVYWANVIIGVLERDPDPRAPQCIEILEKQRDNIQAQLDAATRDEHVVGDDAGANNAPVIDDDDKPPPVVVSLDKLSLNAKVLSPGRE